MHSAEPPGEDLVREGLRDLSSGVATPAALLVSIGAPRLRRLGIAVPSALPAPEHQLYALLSESGVDSAHGRYNALVRRLVSFECAGTRALADEARIERLMKALGAEADAEARVYFTGGATAVLLGWRASTIDVDLKIVPDRDRLYRALPVLKERLEINLELAAPDDFIPVREGWEDRSPFIRREGRVSFHHFDLYAQALAKIERGHSQDLADVSEMLARSLVDREKAVEYYEAIEPKLYRYPASDAPTFRRAVLEFFGRQESRG